MRPALSRVLGLLDQPRAYQALRWQPRSLAALELCNRLALLAPGLRAIIDGGANVGQFARAATETYPDAQIFSFEPLPEAGAAFRDNLKGRSQVRLFPSALGAREGVLTFYPNAYSQSSSALHLTPEHRRSFGQDKELPPTTVPVTTLDALAAGTPLPRPLLVKLDLQGYELNALLGGRQMLATVDQVLVETVFRPMYEGEPLFDDLRGFLLTQGFRFVMPLAFLEDDAGLIVQMDALFARSPSSPTGATTPGSPKA